MKDGFVQTPGRGVWGALLALAAVAVLFLGWGEAFNPLAQMSYGVSMVPDPRGGIVTKLSPGLVAEKTGLRVGDVVDLSALSLSDRYRLRMGSPPGTVVNVSVIRDAARRVVTLRPQVARNRAKSSAVWAILLNITATLLIVAFIAFRKPSIATAALVLYGMGAVQSGVVGVQFSWIPNPWYGAVFAIICILVSTLPMMALLPFIVRFPQLPVTPVGRLRMHIADGLFVVGAVLVTIQSIYEPLLFESWQNFNNALVIVTFLLVLIFGMLTYRDTAGEDRRRIAWVIAGLVASAIGYALFNIFEFQLSLAMQAVTLLLTCSLPIALAYAVLRHRVLDLGFALNRTAVYAVMTTVVIGVVSLADWLSARLLAERRLAVAVEAIVTISFGFALNWIHGRTERLIDQVVFRQRHIAEKRIEYRIGALGFAASTGMIDEAMAGDAAEILDLASAAVFTRDASTMPFRRGASTGWSDAGLATIDDDSLVVCTLKSLERPVFLDDVAIALENAPTGIAHPTLVIPIIGQHELIGFVLYGPHRDGASLDPEEVSLLARLCAAAANAYGAVENRQWRERALQLQTASP